LLYQKKEIESNTERIQKDLTGQEEKKERARKTVTQRMATARSKGIDLSDSNPHIIQAKLDIESNLTKTYFSSLFELFNEYPELNSFLAPHFKDKGLNLPERPPSSIDTRSVRSSASNL
jgi:hypothetical protein